MEHVKQEIKLEPKEENNFGEPISEEGQLKNEENAFVKTIMMEEMIKTEDDQFSSPAPAKAYVSDEERIENDDTFKVQLSENQVKAGTIKIEELKTLVIKEEIDEKCCVEGLKAWKEDIKNIIYTFPMKTPKELPVNNLDEVSDNDCRDLSLNVSIEKDQETSAGSTSSKVKKKYLRPLKFVCSYCNKRFTTITVLRAHTRIHTGQRPYCCSYCGKHFRTKTLLKLHLQLHTKKRYECTECDMKFPQVGPLNVHKRTHSGERPFQCSKCGSAFVSKTLLITHLKSKCFLSHFLPKLNSDESYVCSMCNKNFNRKDMLSSHIQSVHLKVKSFPCRVCGMLSFTPANRRKHERLHENKFRFTCQKCNLSFKEKGSLKIHMESSHSEIKPFSCDLCNKSFKNVSNLNTHKEVHHTEKNPNKYVCDVCNMGFYLRRYLKRHQQTHTDLDKTLTCYDCGIRCRSKTDMKRHVVTHIGGGDKPFKCGICAMAFDRRTKMMRHQLVHSDEKPYKCDLCSKGYKDSSSLRIHKDSFHFKKRFICDKCGFKSVNESSFKRHIRHKMCKI